MRKIWVFLFLGVALLPHSAGAKVCFLPSIFGGDEYCLSDEEATQYEGCRGFEQTTPCLPGQEQISCTKGNVTYYHCYCREDTYKYEDYPQYQCKEGYTEECGCAAKNVECKPEYKYKGDGLGYCKQWKNAIGIDACILPNGEVYYKDCACNGDDYPTTCYETGLKRPIDEKYICTQPDGAKYYAGCECDMNGAWSPNACAERANGCTEGVTTVESVMPERGANGETQRLVCTKCQDVVCPDDDMVNIETRYCERTDEVTYDCELLGYTYAPTGTCPAGTGNAGQSGVRCPFDRNFMNCSAMQNCYPNERSCLLDNPGATTCELDSSAEGVCYKVTACDSATGYIFDGTGCKSAGCPMGYKAGLTEVECPSGSTLETIAQKSGGEVCAKCKCTPEATCYYTSQQHDMSTVVINGESYTPIYAGYGSLVGLCCNGYYAACNNLCSGRDFEQDYDPNMQDWETCEACGKKYYTIKTCQDGYELKSGQCQMRQCDEVNGYSVQFQSTSECVDNSGLYEGAVGWKIEVQKENGNNVHSGSGTCGKCVCTEPEDPTENDMCRWSNNNKNKNGVLKEQDLCCNGYYQRCYSNAPAGATSDACNDPNAVEMDDYLACDFDRTCMIKTCKTGYELQGNVCVLSKCPEDFDTSKQTLGECGEGTGWNFEIKKDASGQNVTRGDQLCTKCTCSPASGCKWSVANAGNADLDGLCCDGSYTTCESTCVGHAYADLVTGTGAAVDQGVASKQECEGCGVKLYTATACRTTNGYVLSGTQCQHVGCPSGWTSGLSTCDEGYTAVAHPTNTDNGQVCGQCQETPCADGYAKEVGDCVTAQVTETKYWKLDTSKPNGKSGPKTCYKCTPKTCVEMGGKTTCDEANENSTILAYYNGSEYKTDCNTCTEKTADEKCEYRYGNGWYGYEAGRKCSSIGTTGVFTKSSDNKCFTCLKCSDAGPGYYPTALSCARGYTCEHDAETACYTVTGCASGFYKDDCATLTNGNAGWKWTEIVLGAPYNTVSCGQCTAKECTDGLSTTPNCAPISETIAWSDTVFSGASKCGSCVCAAGYASTLDGCGPTKANGWKFNDLDTNACKKCVVKTCADYGFEEDGGDRLGYIKEERKVTIGDNAAYTCYEYVAKTSCDRGVLNEEQCGVGSWKLSEWNGDKAGLRECYDCLPVRTVCPSGTASTDDLKTCGLNGAKGWEVTETISTYKNGNEPCYTCEPLECEQNYSTSKTCDAASEIRVASETRFSGASTCYTCLCNTPNYQSAATSCGSKGSFNGWKFLTSNTCNLCYEKDCTDHGYETEACPEGYNNDQSTGVYLGDKSTTCYKCKAAPCAEGYATVGNGCGAYRTLNMSVTKSKSGEDICYQCICDNSKGYYATCPDGASCAASLVDGCYKTTGCATNLVANGTEGLSYFKTSNPKTFNVNGASMTCSTVDGCDNAVARNTAPTTLQTQMFESSSYTLGGKTCWFPTSCKVGYLQDRTCEDRYGAAYEAVQVDTWISMTCRMCKEKSCDSQGFYELSGTSHICPTDRLCTVVNTPLGSKCQNSTTCLASANYVSSSAKDDALYLYGPTNPVGKALQDTLDCAMLTGCNNEKGSYDTIDGLANYLGVIKELVASEVHRQAVSTCYTGEIFCNNTIGYWDTTQECLNKYPGHLCEVHNASGCYVMAGCNNASGHFDTNPQCVGAYTGRLCALDNTSNCYMKAGCNNATGHFDTNALCVSAYTGRLCALDNASQCYKRAGCDNSSGHYDTEPQCLSANAGYLCAMESSSGCYKKTTCNSTHCGPTCGTTTVQCPSNTYPYPKKDNAVMSGECQPISAGGTFTCSYDAKMYKSFICNTGWKKNATEDACIAKTCADYSDTPDTSCDTGCYICGSESVPTGNGSTTCWHKTAKVCTDYSGWIAANARSTTYFTYKEEDKCTGATNTKCYKLDACNSTNGWLPASDVDGDKFTYSTQTSGSLTCRKATACNENKGWYAYSKLSQYAPYFAMASETKSGVTCYKITGCLSTGGVTATKPGGCKTYKTATYGTLPCYYDISSTGAADCTTTNPGDCKKWSTSTDTNGNTVYYNISNVGTNSSTTKPTGCKTWNYENGTNGNTCYWNASAVFGSDCTTQKPGACKTYSTKANTDGTTYYYSISTTGASDCTTTKPTCKTWTKGTDTNGNTVYYSISDVFGSSCVTAGNRTNCYKYSSKNDTDGTTWYYNPQIMATGASTTKPTGCQTWSSGNPSANGGNTTTCYWGASGAFASDVTTDKPGSCKTYTTKNNTDGVPCYYNISTTGASDCNTTKPTGCKTWSTGTDSNGNTIYYNVSAVFGSDCTTQKPAACKTYSTKKNSDNTTYYYNISTTGAADCTTTKPSCKTWTNGTDTNGNAVYYSISSAFGSSCTTSPTSCYNYTSKKDTAGTTWYYNPSIIATGATTTKPSVTASNCHSFSTGSGTNGVTCYYNDQNVTSSKPSTTTTTASGDSTSCTLSQSCSASCSESQSCSASCSDSTSCSASCSDSTSCSGSYTDSASCSGSYTDSASCSNTYTDTASCSNTYSDSQSCSASCGTESQSCDCGTQTRSGTKYGTQSRSCTQSGTKSRTCTQSGTKYRTCTQSGTKYRTCTQSGTKYRSGTKYGTKYRSGTKYGTQSRSGTKYGTQYRSGTKYRDINYTRSVTCNANGGGWDTGSWTVSSYGSWGSCSSSASWGSCTDFGSCQWGGWGSCGSYGSCSWNDWGSCTDYGSCQWGDWGSCNYSSTSCGGYGDCNYSSTSCGGYGSCNYSSTSCGGYGSCSYSSTSCGDYGSCSYSSTSCGGWGSCGSYGSCSWGSWGSCSGSACSTFYRCCNGSCVRPTICQAYNRSECITVLDHYDSCTGDACYAFACDGLCSDGRCVERPDCIVTTCTAVSIPANASCSSYCTPQYSDCTTGTRVCTAWSCNSGYVKSGNVCVSTGGGGSLVNMCVKCTLSGYACTTDRTCTRGAFSDSEKCKRKCLTISEEIIK